MLKKQRTKNEKDLRRPNLKQCSRLMSNVVDFDRHCQDCHQHGFSITVQKSVRLFQQGECYFLALMVFDSVKMTAVLSRLW